MASEDSSIKLSPTVAQVVSQFGSAMAGDDAIDNDAINKNCKSYLYVSPHKGRPEEMRCNCGATSINLKTDA